MEIINKKLQDSNLTLEQLSPEIQNEIKELQGMIEKFNEAVDEYEKDGEKNEETEKKLDDYEDYIMQTEKGIAEKIVAPEAGGNKDEKTKGEEKDSSIGWILFGGLVLVATLGAVNVLKKK